jgi:hypothetical protein
MNLNIYSPDGRAPIIGLPSMYVLENQKRNAYRVLVGKPEEDTRKVMVDIKIILEK